MTIDEKVKELENICAKYTNCSDGCPLYDIKRDLRCMYVGADDATIERLYNMTFPTTTIKDDKPTSVEQHMNIAVELNQLYAKKNKDYGDSFHTSFVEEGMAMARIRLGDKLSRFKTLTKNNQQEVKDESIRDTLIDLANYAIMTVMEIDRKD